LPVDHPARLLTASSQRTRCTLLSDESGAVRAPPR
jgi:hypothetical protein